jgi:hypothetical protein
LPGLNTGIFISELAWLELKALTPVVSERELHFVVVHIEAIGEIDAPSPLKFAAHRYWLYGVV